MRRLFNACTKLLSWLANHTKTAVIVLDVIVISSVPLFKWLLGCMLAVDRPCSWTILGAKCATCGGTHCIQSFLQGAIWESFCYNPMVFCWILYAMATGLLLIFSVIFRQKWAFFALKKMYTMTVFYVTIAVYILFGVLRNFPVLFSLVG